MDDILYWLVYHLPNNGGTRAFGFHVKQFSNIDKRIHTTLRTYGYGGYFVLYIDDPFAFNMDFDSFFASLLDIRERHRKQNIEVKIGPRLIGSHGDRILKGIMAMKKIHQEAIHSFSINFRNLGDDVDCVKMFHDFTVNYPQCLTRIEVQINTSRHSFVTMCVLFPLMKHTKFEVYNSFPENDDENKRLFIFLKSINLTAWYFSLERMRDAELALELVEKSTTLKDVGAGVTSDFSNDESRKMMEKMNMYCDGTAYERGKLLALCSVKNVPRLGFNSFLRLLPIDMMRMVGTTLINVHKS